MRKILACLAVPAAFIGLTFVNAGPAAAADCTPVGEPCKVSTTWGFVSGMYSGDAIVRYALNNKDRQAGGGCTLLERKSTALGGFTSDGISGEGKQHCYGDTGPYPTVADISPTYDADTTGIRIRELGTNRTAVLCSTQTECRSLPWF